jgi:hypothetical protein
MCGRSSAAGRGDSHPMQCVTLACGPRRFLGFAAFLRLGAMAVWV